MLLVQWAQQTEHCQSHPVWKIQDTETSVSLLVSSSKINVSFQVHTCAVHSLPRSRDQTED